MEKRCEIYFTICLARYQQTKAKETTTLEKKLKNDKIR